jgi:hypothetical protein
MSRHTLEVGLATSRAVGLAKAEARHAPRSRIEISETLAPEIFCSSYEVRNPGRNQIYYEGDYRPVTSPASQTYTFPWRRPAAGQGIPRAPH